MFSYYKLSITSCVLHPMVAEQILFLSKDRDLQVRAHSTQNGKCVFCVKDFIRVITTQQIGPDDALVYWLSSMASLTHEKEILDSRLVQFLGPYETPQVCISAEGLLILYNHLNERFSWVDPNYTEEVQDTLLSIAHNKNWEGYVEMYDDGEIEEQLIERGDMDLDCPPKGSKFLYEDYLGENHMSVEEVVGALRDSQQLTKKLKAQLEYKSNELLVANDIIKEMTAENETKRRKLAAFTVGSLIGRELNLTQTYKEQLCKKVISNYRTRFPEREVLKKHGAVFFYEEDRPIVEALLLEELEGLDD